MGPFEIGLVLPVAQYGPERTTPRWTEMRDIARLGEENGYDTVWIADELLWQVDGEAPQGAWDGVSVAGAVAAVTSRIKVGSWVLSALHRNPGIIAKTAETLDEISGGRFVFGLGAGHEWPGQAHAFGLPEQQIFSRFEEALQIIIPLMRQGRADFEGKFHAARDLVQQPVGPRPNAIPLLIGGNGPKAQRHAAHHADIWSCYIEERAHVAELRPRIESLEKICQEVGRDPESIGRAVGVVVRPLEPAGAREGSVSGTAEEIAGTLGSFRDIGFTHLDLSVNPGTVAALGALAPAIDMLRARTPAT
ncbi:MAG TPA: LLM class flavin-dependent oxidoreductase [Acidimicrobiia bacterium]|nr:LLM class flavin-dependent oxidoreductase [Acidimicrobiia bacterium]